VTPNILTETSNLLGYIDEPAKTDIFRTFGEIIQESTEHFVASRIAIAATEFIRFGLTDAVSLETTNPEHYLLTTDMELYLCRT
jgi:hypothetical protein